MKFKNFLMVAAAFAFGCWLLYSGWTDYQNNQRLQAEGKTASALVMDHTKQIRSRGANRYYLTVRFDTEPGQTVHQRVSVNKAQYTSATIGSASSVRYLPANPAICAVGEAVPVWRGEFLSGAILLVSGCVLSWLYRRRLTTPEAAKKVAERVAALCETQYEYAAVNAKDFGHLGLAWYDRSGQWLAQNGFAHLGDEENLTFRRISKGNRTLLRTFLGRDGTVLAYLYHFKPNRSAGAAGGDGFRILEFQTHFANGAFLTTSNAEAAGKLDSPPGVDALHLPANNPQDTILNKHVERFNAWLAAHEGVAAGRMMTLDDVHRVQNVLQQIKAAFRQNTGITREELQRLAGPRLCPQQIDALHADVAKLHA